MSGENSNRVKTVESVQTNHAADQTDAILPVSLLNVNKYASTKTLSQGMLDLALLSANAAQLKYIIATGDKQNYHILLLCLVSFSICLQVLQAVVCIILGLVLDISKVSDQKRAIIVNNVSLVIAVIVVAINVVISAFDIKSLPEVE